MKEKRGQVYWVDLGGTVGCEQGGERPCVIISNDIGNYHAPIATVAPITTKKKRDLPTHVMISDEDSCLKRESTILLEQLRTVDKRRFQFLVGELSENTMKKIDEALHIALQ